MKIQFQCSEVSVLCRLSTSGYRTPLGGRVGGYIILNGQRKAVIKKCPYDPKELSMNSMWGRRVVRRKDVPLEEGECVKVWRQENYWNCR